MRDLEKSKKFYQSHFSWKTTGDENKDYAYWLIDTGEKPSAKTPIAGSIAEVYGLRGAFMVNFIGSLIVSSLLLTLFSEKKKSNK